MVEYVNAKLISYIKIDFPTEAEMDSFVDMIEKFIAQGKTPQEVHDNLPKDNGKFYLAEDGHREIKEELECMRLKST